MITEIEKKNPGFFLKKNCSGFFYVWTVNQKKISFIFPATTNIVTSQMFCSLIGYIFFSKSIFNLFGVQRLADWLILFYDWLNTMMMVNLTSGFRPFHVCVCVCLAILFWRIFLMLWVGMNFYYYYFLYFPVINRIFFFFFMNWNSQIWMCQKHLFSLIMLSMLLLLLLQFGTLKTPSHIDIMIVRELNLIGFELFLFLYSLCCCCCFFFNL